MKIRELFIFKMDSIVLSVSSVLFGFMLFAFPDILQYYKVYTIIRDIFDNKTIGFAFMLFALSKLVGVVFNWRWVKRISIQGLLFLWLLFLIAFVITPPPNTIWVLAFTNSVLAVGATIKEKER